MILQLKNKRIDIPVMSIPEPLSKVYITYTYERGAGHLLPCLIINSKKFTGDKIYIDIRDLISKDKVELKVELLDGYGKPIRTYTGTFPYAEYCIIGTKPVRPDIEQYIRKLHKEREELYERIDELTNIGEVI